MNGIVHVEIPTTNFEKSVAFYSSVFGWEVTPLPGQDYWLWKAPDGPGGAFAKADDIKEAGPAIYIEVEDIPGALEKIEGQGGKTQIEKTEIGGGMGFFALFLDCVGNRLGLWSQS